MQRKKRMDTFLGSWLTGLSHTLLSENTDKANGNKWAFNLFPCSPRYICFPLHFGCTATYPTLPCRVTSSAVHTAATTGVHKWHADSLPTPAHLLASATSSVLFHFNNQNFRAAASPQPSLHSTFLHFFFFAPAITWQQCRLCIYFPKPSHRCWFWSNWGVMQSWGAVGGDPNP